MIKIVYILKMLLGILLILVGSFMALVGLTEVGGDQTLKIVFFIISILFIYPGIVAIRSAKTLKIKGNSAAYLEHSKTNIKFVDHLIKNYNSNTPKEILQDMKKHYDINEIPNLLRILNDCKKIVKTSNNIESVISRLELGAQKSFVLKQLEEIGLYRDKPTADVFLNYFIGQKDNILLLAVERSYVSMMDSADKLKTESGRKNRINKFFQDLEKYSAEFEYNECGDYINLLKSNINII